MSFAPGIRLELRQQQSLVLTPQLQQAIRLLQMSNLELASAIDQEVAENPFLQRSDARGRAAPGRGRDGEPRAATGAAPPAAERRRRRPSPFRAGRLLAVAQAPGRQGVRRRSPAVRGSPDPRQGPARASGRAGPGHAARPARAGGRASASSRASTTTAICARTTRRWRRAAASTPAAVAGGARGDPALRADRRRRARPRRMPGAAAGREGPARPGDGDPGRQPAAAGPRRFRRADAALRRRRRGSPGHDRRDQAAGPEARAELRRRRAADAGPRPLRPRCWSPAAGGSS